VLSACDTGIGDIDAVDGHASLLAAFLRAGANTVVASLWKVPDEATRDLMIRFYDLLDTGQGPSEALRITQLERHAAGDPVLNWGAFVCYCRG
jgi:CHAT domain-containing protein